MLLQARQGSALGQGCGVGCEHQGNAACAIWWGAEHLDPEVLHESFCFLLSGEDLLGEVNLLLEKIYLALTKCGTISSFTVHLLHEGDVDFLNFEREW